MGPVRTASSSRVSAGMSAAVRTALPMGQSIRVSTTPAMKLPKADEHLIAKAAAPKNTPSCRRPVCNSFSSEMSAMAVPMPTISWAMVVPAKTVMSVRKPANAQEPSGGSHPPKCSRTGKAWMVIQQRPPTIIASRLSSQAKNGRATA